MPTLKSQLVEACGRVWKAFMAYGPVDDGRPEGDEFDTALMEMRITARRTKAQTTRERAVLVAVVNAHSEHPETMTPELAHYLKEAAEVLDTSDLVVED